MQGLRMTIPSSLAVSAARGDAAGAFATLRPAATSLPNTLPNTLGLALTWLLGSLLTALVCWVVSMLLERRSPHDPAERALLFVAYLLMALGGAALALEGHEFTDARPVLAAPLPLLAYFFFYLFSDGDFAGARERWLSLLFVINRIALYAPQGSSKTSSSAAYLALLSVPGVMGFILTFSAFGAIALTVIALPPQVFARYRRRRVEGLRTRGSARRWLGAAALLCLVGYLMFAALVWMTFAPWQSVAALVAIAGALCFALCALAPLTASFVLARGRTLDGDGLRSRALR